MTFNQLNEYTIKKNLYSFLVDKTDESRLSCLFDEKDEKVIKLFLKN
ncbi:MAG: hypothetical protein AB1782_06850 [Cyanobacteriota bacterium]